MALPFPGTGSGSGHEPLTPAVAPAAAGLNSRAAVKAYCAAEFGAGWEVAEFHDGWGWDFTAYGNVGTAPRFWVDINDQPGGNCW